MSNNPMENRTAFVTGSVQGIGPAVAKSLAAAGANVALHGLAASPPLNMPLPGHATQAGNRRLLHLE